MKIQLLTTTLLLITCLSNGQSFSSSENLSVSKQELELNYYEKDSTANAIVLYEYGNSYVDEETFYLHTEIKKKIKILNKKGFDKATITEYLYENKSRKERVENIIGTTYNIENDQLIKTQLNKQSIFEEQYDDNHSIIKFTFPNVKEGSVITYSYTIISPYMFKYKGWEFQDDIPKIYSEYNTSIPGNWEYNIKLVGYLKLEEHEEDIKKNCLNGGNGSYAHCVETKYVMKDIPAYKDEDYMTEKYNYLARIDYELKTMRFFDGRVEHYTKTWDNVDKELKTDESIGKQLKKSSVAKDILPEEILNESDNLKKAQLIYHFVQENYTWNGEFKLFKDVNIKNLVKEKTGNVGEINILLHNLLQEADINIHPVILSTRDNGFPTKIYPVLSDFNYIIVEANINGKLYLLDATNKYLSFGEIPYRCLNQDGRLLNFKNGSSWIEIKPEKTSSILYQIKLSVEDDTFQGEVKTSARGYRSHSKKKSYFENPNEYFSKYQEDYPNYDIYNHEVISQDKKDFDFTESFDIEFSPNMDGKLYLDPFLFKFISQNPFKLQERSYPIDFGFKDTFIYNIEIDFGENYNIMEIPESRNFSLPDNKGRVIFSSMKENNKVLIMLKIDFLDEIFEPFYYPALKEFMDMIVNTQTKSYVTVTKA